MEKSAKIQLRKKICGLQLPLHEGLDVVMLHGPLGLIHPKALRGLNVTILV